MLKEEQEMEEEEEKEEKWDVMDVEDRRGGGGGGGVIIFFRLRSVFTVYASFKIVRYCAIGSSPALTEEALRNNGVGFFF